MSLPFDPEEIFGVAAVDVMRRVGTFLGCLLGASVIAALALGMGDSIVNLDVDRFGDWLEVSYLLFLLPFISSWVLVYFPVVLISGYVFFIWQRSLVRPALVVISVEALLIVFTASGLEWECLVSVIMLAGCIGAMFWLGLIVEQKLRARAESHLMGVSIENQLRREGLRDKFGTEVTEHYIELDDGP